MAIKQRKRWEWVFRGYAYKTLTDLATDFGQDMRSVWQRLNKYGFTLEEALGLKKRKRHGPRYKQVKVGDQFGFLEATSNGWMQGKKQMVMAKCLRCNVGKPRRYQVGNLRDKDGHTKSCGCLSRDTTSQVMKLAIHKDQIHGHWKAVEDCRSVDWSSCRHVKCLCMRCNDGIPHDKPVSQFLKTESCHKCSRLQSINVKHEIGKGDLYGEGRLCVVSDPFTDRSKKSNRRSVKVFCLNCDERNIFPATVQYLEDGVTTSCGCYQREQASKAAVRDLCENLKYLWIYQGLRGKKFMRSRWELALAHVLDERDVEWQHEPETFELSSDMRYTPDFYLPGADQYIEVKGRQMEDWPKKRELFSKDHKLLVVDKTNLTATMGCSDWKLRRMYPADLFRIHKSAVT
jgi:hypothetical protein